MNRSNIIVLKAKRLLLRDSSFKVQWKTRSAECGVRSVENAECGKCGVWKMRSVENAGCGKCGVWKMRSVENAECRTNLKKKM